jgi:acetyl esterase/lipase
MARIGPVWADDIRGHIAAMIEGFSAVHQSAPKQGVTVERNVNYGPHPRHELDVYLPSAGGLRPALVFIHGGAFTEGHRNRSPEIYANVLYYMARHGVVGINANYRLAPDVQHPESAYDVGSVVAWVRSNAARLGVDASRIFVLGHSAGAAHVASFAYDARVHGPDGPGIAGAIIVSGRVRADNLLVNPNARKVEAYYGADVSRFDELSPVGMVTAQSPPTLVAWAEYENPLLDVYSLELAYRLAAARGRAGPVLRLAGHNHTSIIAHINLAEDRLGSAIRAFIERPD